MTTQVLNLTCTVCGERIPSEDQNPDMGTVFCLACGTVHDLARLEELNKADTEEFDRFILAHLSRSNPDRIYLHLKRGNSFLLLPVAIILLYYTIEMVYLALPLIEKFAPVPTLLFLVPFLLGLIAFWIAVLYRLIGNVALTVDRKQGVLVYQVLLGPLAVFQKGLAISSESVIAIELGNSFGRNSKIHRIRVASKSGSLVFGSVTLEDDDLDHVCRWLREKACGVK